MTDMAVVVAYRDMGDLHRRASAAYVLAWYGRLGYEVVLSVGDSNETFTRASAINAGVRACDADIIVQSDPDSLVPAATLAAAIAMAVEADGLVIPHDRYFYLSEMSTAQVLAGERDVFDVDEDDCELFGVLGSGNVVVFSRKTWERAGGYDERFGLWGGDDGALAVACDALVAPTRRLPGPVCHLYHPRLPQSVPGHPGYLEQMSLAGLYRDASAEGPDAVRRLVAER